MMRSRSSQDQLPPSEALPGVLEGQVVFHNGEGYYYFCEEFNLHLKERLFKCVKKNCEATAKMGPMRLGFPLIDIEGHSHLSDIYYRQKCILLHTIRRRFTIEEDVSALTILQNVLKSYHIGGQYSPSDNIEVSIIQNDDKLFMDLIEEENDCMVPIPTVIDDQPNLPQLDEPCLPIIPVRQTYTRKNIRRAVVSNMENSEPLLNNSKQFSNENDVDNMSGRGTFNSEEEELPNLSTVEYKPFFIIDSQSHPIDSYDPKELYGTASPKTKAEEDTEVEVKTEFVDVNEICSVVEDELNEHKLESPIVSSVGQGKARSHLLNVCKINEEKSDSSQTKRLKVRTDLKVKKKRRTWDEWKLLEALSSVERKELSAKEACRMYNIPRNTFKHNLQRFRSDPDNFFIRKLGRPLTLSTEIDNKLVEYCLKLKSVSNYTYGQLGRYAYVLSQELGVKTQFNQRTKSAGRDWINLFLKRHPECRK